MGARLVSFATVRRYDQPGHDRPRVSRPGCPAEAGSRLDPAAELILRDRTGNGSVGKHTLRTVVHYIIVVEQLT